ncbi:MAG: ECF-type sigma factor [Prosthecobacter sp.]
MKTQASPFPTTHWTLIQCVQEGTPEEAAKAMEEICKNYWFPIYAYLRRSGRGVHDAEDITQAFFQQLIAEETIKNARQDRGKLRSFLLTVLVRLLSDQGRHNKALKRGGGHAVVSFDAMAAEERYSHEPQDVRDPEKIFLHAWAGDVLYGVHARLKAAFEDEGRLEMFEALDSYLGSEDVPPPYEELAIKLGSTAGAVRLLVHRLRKKFRTLLEREIAKTVMKPEDIAEELAWLRQVMANS